MSLFSSSKWNRGVLELLPLIRGGLPKPFRPQVTVVVPAYNNFEITVACLTSLAKHKAETRFEVLLLDDGSTDRRFKSFRFVRGLRVKRAITNMGFLKVVNSPGFCS